jgi:hypothetical protein
VASCQLDPLIPDVAHNVNILLYGRHWEPEEDEVSTHVRSMHLQGEAKERFNEIQQELSQLSTKFTNNVMDSTKAFKKLLTDKADVDGLPATALELASQTAKSEGHEKSTPEEGPWMFTLDIPSYQPVMTHAKNRCDPVCLNRLAVHEWEDEMLLRTMVRSRVVREWVNNGW